MAPMLRVEGVQVARLYVALRCDPLLPLAVGCDEAAGLGGSGFGVQWPFVPGLLGGFVATFSALQSCHGDRPSRTGNGDFQSRARGIIFPVSSRSLNLFVFQ